MNFYPTPSFIETLLLSPAFAETCKEFAF